MHENFSVPQIEYPLGGGSKKGSHVYFLLIVTMVLLLWCLIGSIITFISYNITIWKNNAPRKYAAGSIHDYLFCYCPIVDILFEVLRIIIYWIHNRCYVVECWKSVCVYSMCAFAWYSDISTCMYRIKMSEDVPRLLSLDNSRSRDDYNKSEDVPRLLSKQRWLQVRRCA